MIEPFVKEICEYIESNTSGRFNFGTGSGNLKVGELVRDSEGVWAMAVPAPQPEKYTPIEYKQVSFVTRSANSTVGFDDLSVIKNLLHRAEHYETDNYQVYFSHATGDIEDQDRDAEGSKLWRVSILFIVRSLIS